MTDAQSAMHDYSTELQRLIRLLRQSAGVRAIALYDDTTVQPRLLAQIRAALAPVPVREVSLLDGPPNLQALLAALPPAEASAVVCLTGVGAALERGLAGVLEAQAADLCRLQVRLLFWVTHPELEQLHRQAPTFAAQISAIFSFFRRFAAGELPMPDSLQGPDRQWSGRSATSPLHQRGIVVGDERERPHLIELQHARIEQLEQSGSADPQTRGATWEELGLLYSQAERPIWDRAAAAFAAAAQCYAADPALAAQQTYAQLQAGIAAYRAYDLDNAALILELALTGYQSIGDQRGEASVHQALGDLQQFRQDNDAALGSFQQARDRYQMTGDQRGEADVHKAIGDIQQFRDERDAALRSYQQALTRYRAIGDRRGEANVLLRIGKLRQLRNEHAAAQYSFQQALARYQTAGDRLGEANVRQALGDLQQFQTEYGAALQSYQKALDLYQALDNRLGEANVLLEIGKLQQAQDQQASALRSFEQALSNYQAIGDRLGKANVLLCIGKLQQAQTEHAAALESFQQARAHYQAIGDRLGEANVLAAQSRLLLDIDGEQSHHLLEQALMLRDAIADAYGAAADLGNYGSALLRRGRGAEALTYLQRARDGFATQGLTQMQAHAEKLIAQASNAAA